MNNFYFCTISSFASTIVRYDYYHYIFFIISYYRLWLSTTSAWAELDTLHTHTHSHSQSNTNMTAVCQNKYDEMRYVRDTRQFATLLFYGDDRYMSRKSFRFSVFIVLLCCCRSFRMRWAHDTQKPSLQIKNDVIRNQPAIYHRQFILILLCSNFRTQWI